MTEDERREFHEQWMLLMLGHARMRPGYLINPDIPEQTAAKLRAELADTSSAADRLKPDR